MSNQCTATTTLIFGALALLTSLSPAVISVLSPWTEGPYHGTPPLDKVNTSVFHDSIVEGIRISREQLDNLTKLVPTPAEATFANTIEYLENCGRPLNRALFIFWAYTSSVNTAALRNVSAKINPQITKFYSDYGQNKAIFERVKTVYDKYFTSNGTLRSSSLRIQQQDQQQPNASTTAPGSSAPASSAAPLTSEQLVLLENHYGSFVGSGALLSAEQKQQLAAIDNELDDLQFKFSENVQYDEAERFIVIDNEEELAGLPSDYIAATKAAAEARAKEDTECPCKWKGRYLIGNSRSAVTPILTLSPFRDLRQKVFKMFVSRGEHEGEHDNRPIIVKMLKLREQQAHIFGYNNYAEMMLASRMAKKPQNAIDLMDQVAVHAGRAANETIALMSEMAKKDGIAPEGFAAWDFRYYQEKLRKEKYDLDSSEVKPYLTLENMLAASHYAAHLVHNMTFVEVKNVTGWHPDTRVFQVLRAFNGSAPTHIGMFYWDPFSRSGKNSGAWMSSFRKQEKFPNSFESPVVHPIVTNNLNFVKSTVNGTMLISWEEATTLFHELGHALHGLLSDVTYPSLSGTSVSRDFVEMPSQLNERYLSTPEVLSRYAKHFSTGEVIPEALLQKINEAKNYDQGFSTMEYLASAVYDMAVHMANASTVTDPIAFENKVRADMKIHPAIALRHRPTHFGHIFTGGYSAGYYSYLWADVIAADASEAFAEGNRWYDQQLAGRFRDLILSRGGTVDLNEAYRKFRGREPVVDALLRERGFIPSKGGNTTNTTTTTPAPTAPNATVTSANTTTAAAPNSTVAPNITAKKALNFLYRSKKDAQLRDESVEILNPNFPIRVGKRPTDVHPEVNFEIYG